ncbi:MAG: hemerythrin domain-containing protein [Armatimonadetes bacterium]|nr:hemerythrin domain-containing protein [Armatimonadota bacterium]
MYATQDLRDEHEGIKVALAVLDRLAGRIEADDRKVLDDVEQIVDFLKTFADRCHHGKEEDLLFPALESAGVPRENGPIGVMLAEHTGGREYIRAMGDALRGLREGASGAASAFADAAHGYARLLGEHIEKENDVLFTIAESRLTPEQHARLAEGFEQIEQERIGPGVHERYHALLDRLRDTYLA